MTTLKRLIYVEDEAEIREIASVALELVGGYDVQIYGSGAEAIANAVAFNPQFIILDVMMPDMDGPTTLANLRTRPELTSTPVVFMTAKVQPNEVTELLALGALAVIAKPFDPMTLSNQLSDIWEQRNV
ncbi:MAG: response regulator [Methylococcales bacterium]|nr:response regulator [Methylococcales bacterium]